MRLDSAIVLEWLTEVTDPEIPVLNIVEMGIVRGVQIGHAEPQAPAPVTVRITPTYSGCPAMNVIEADIKSKLAEKGTPHAQVVTDWTEVWTTDWFTEEALAKLKAYGIAPPPRRDASASSLGTSALSHDASASSLGTSALSHDAFKSIRKIVPCPLCDALDTRLVSEFGSTACKSQYICEECRNPFEHFKCI